MWADLSPWASVAVTAAALLTLVVAGWRAPGIARVLLIGQAVYWALGFVVRPAVLLGVQPPPAFADNIADPRLFVPGYENTVPAVLWPVAAGLWCYALLALLLAEWLRARRSVAASVGGARHLDVASAGSMNLGARWFGDGSPRWLPAFAIAYVAGMLARLFAYQQELVGSAGDVEAESGIVATATALAGIGAVTLVIYYRAAPRQQAIVLGVVGLGELAWAVVSESKTPVIGLAFAFAIRLARQGIDRRRLLILAGAGLGVLLAFGWLQSFKADDSIPARAELAANSYPQWLQGALPLVRRFDLFEASSDVYAAGPLHYLDPGEVVRHVLTAFVPSQLGVEKALAGPMWAEQVRGATLDMRGVSVSLAEGHINEGLLLGGATGVLVESVLLLGCVYLVSRWLDSPHVFLVALAVTLIQTPALFERGILGIAETAGKGLQLAVAIFALDSFIRWYQERCSLPSLAHAAHRRIRVSIHETEART